MQDGNDKYVVGYFSHQYVLFQKMERMGMRLPFFWHTRKYQGSESQ